MIDRLRRAQAERRDTLARLAIERDPEMCQFYEQVAAQWTIEIKNLRRSHSYRRRIAHAFKTRSIAWSVALLLVSALRNWRWSGGRKS